MPVPAMTSRAVCSSAWPHQQSKNRARPEQRSLAPLLPASWLLRWSEPWRCQRPCSQHSARCSSRDFSWSRGYSSGTRRRRWEVFSFAAFALPVPRSEAGDRVGHDLPSTNELTLPARFSRQPECREHADSLLSSLQHLDGFAQRLALPPKAAPRVLLLEAQILPRGGNRPVRSAFEFG